MVKQWKTWERSWSKTGKQWEKNVWNGNQNQVKQHKKYLTAIW